MLHLEFAFTALQGVIQTGPKHNNVIWPEASLKSCYETTSFITEGKVKSNDKA